MYRWMWAHRLPPRFARAADGVWSLFMIVALAGALLVALWVATIHDIQRDARVEKLAIERQTMSLARVFEEHTVRTLGAVDQALRFVKFQYERAGDSFDIASAVEQGTIESSLFHQVGVIDSNGIYHLSNLPDFKRVDLSDREHFRVHVQSDSRTYFVSKPVLGRATGAWSVQLTRRINRNDGSLGGVAVISIDPFYFTAFYNEVDVGKKGVVALVGLDGIIRARRSGDEMGVGQDVSRTSLFARLQDAPVGHYTAQSVIDGRTRVHSYRKLPDVPLVVVVGLYEEEAFAELLERRRSKLVFAVGMSLVIALFCALSILLIQRQRRISARLKETQVRAESANRLKSEFLASVSHELRTPMNGIIGYAELIRDLATDKELKGYAKVIFESSEHLLSLLNSILDLARIEAGRIRLRYQLEDVSGVVGEVCSAHGAVAQKKGVALKWSVPPGLSLECDRVHVTQILHNLVQNAIKFTHSGEIFVNVSVGDDECRFDVIDTGVGIAPDLHAAIFERFRQGEFFETRSAGGAGLGLAICRELAELMGGTVRVESTPQVGSTFSFSLPLKHRGTES